WWGGQGGSRGRLAIVSLMNPLDNPFGIGAVAIAFDRQLIIDQQPPVLARDGPAPPVAVDPPAVENTRDRLPSRRRLELGRDPIRIKLHPDRTCRRQQLGHAGFQRIRWSTSGAASA